MNRLNCKNDLFQYLMRDKVSFSAVGKALLHKDPRREDIQETFLGRRSCCECSEDAGTIGGGWRFLRRENSIDPQPRSRRRMNEGQMGDFGQC